jgi:rhamnosyltransferase subunit B
MATVLFTYEFGDGLGHVNRLIAVARRLRNGNRLVFALPEVRLQAPIVRRALGDEVEIREGLFWPAPTDPRSRQVPTDTFADVLKLYGYHQADHLMDAARRGSELLQKIAPNLIVCDFAPTIRLASCGRIPTVVVGNGYSVPPAGQLLPVMRPWQDTVPPTSRLHEALLLAGANSARVKLSGPAVDFLSDLFQGDHTFVCTIAEFDPYQNNRATPLVWPFNIPEMPATRKFDERRGPAIFCYMQRGHPALRPILNALNKMDCKSEIYAQGCDAREIAARCSRRVAVHSSPADFSQVLPESSVLLHHAGLGTAYAGLAAGIPQVVLPFNLEHLITTRGLDKFGVAIRCRASPPPEVPRLMDLLNGVLTDRVRQQAALQAAAELNRRRDNDPLRHVIEGCATYL